MSASPENSDRDTVTVFTGAGTPKPRAPGAGTEPSEALSVREQMQRPKDENQPGNWTRVPGCHAVM